MGASLSTQRYGAYQSWEEQRRQDRIETHLPLVYSLASSLAPRAGQAMLDVSDLIQTGVLGLYRAAETFDEGRGVPFGAYAKPYVRGAMLDEIAKNRSQSRSVRDKYRKIRAAEDALMQRWMREPSEQELADEIGIDMKTLAEWQREIDLREAPSIDEAAVSEVAATVESAEAEQPELSFLQRESKADLVAALGKLDERQQQILYLYYQEELTLKEIGFVLDLSESQVSRLHKRALGHLKQHMEMVSTS